MEKSSTTNSITYRILFSLSLAHFLNDSFQSIISAVYPILKDNLLLSFTQIGLITLVYQICASVFQPVFGLLSDKKPSPWYLVIGSTSTCIGLIFLAYASSLPLVLISVAFVGGPLGDRIGRKYVIWGSILGAAPFALLLPYANLFWTCVLTLFIGFILSSAFSAILVFAQELLPTKVGLISGLFFGLAFGIAGIAAAVLGNLADGQGIEYVYQICSYLPLLGIVTVFLPNVRFNKKAG